MQTPRKTYTREFKLEAVRLYLADDRSGAEVAAELGIRPNALYRWRKEFLEDSEDAFPGHGNLKESEQELARLRRENLRLREDREILKKALQFFSKESR
jgi:transposase